MYKKPIIFNHKIHTIFFKQSERWQFIYYYLCKIIITTNNKYCSV